jgi:hypothetical protein
MAPLVCDIPNKIESNSWVQTLTQSCVGRWVSGFNTVLFVASLRHEGLDSACVGAQQGEIDAPTLLIIFCSGRDCHTQAKIGHRDQLISQPGVKYATYCRCMWPAWHSCKAWSWSEMESENFVYFLSSYCVYTNSKITHYHKTVILPNNFLLIIYTDPI